MAQLITLILGGVLGAVFGSYLATVLLRWPLGETTRKGRSRCDSCAMLLAPSTLVPILSFVILRGRCRGCKAPIPRAHLAMEAAAALIGGASFALFAPDLILALVTALFGWSLLLLGALDWRHFWLPDRLTLPLAVLGLGINLLTPGPGLEAAFIGAVAGLASLTCVAWIYRRLRGRDGLGGGDPKLFGAIGAWLGWQPLAWVLLVAAGLGLTLFAALALARRQDLPEKLPLGTLLAVAAWPLWLVLQLGPMRVAQPWLG